MNLFYASDLTLPNYTLSEEESKHAVRVLRLGVGNTVHLTDGVGGMHEARITDANPKRCLVEIINSVQNFEKREYGLTVAVAPTKSNERFDWLLEKATEVGVDRFIPLDCERSIRDSVKAERCERVIISAVKQSLKAYVPLFDRMAKFDELVRQPFDGVKLIAHCDNNTGNRSSITALIEKGSNVLVLIGPEGDFSHKEIELAEVNGFQAISLGTSRLRTETAALVAVVAVALANI